MKKPLLYNEIAEKCLTKYWGAGPNEDTDPYGFGWDEGSPAHCKALQWAKIHEKEFKKLTWKKIYKLYLETLIQE